MKSGNDLTGTNPDINSNITPSKDYDDDDFEDESEDNEDDEDDDEDDVVVVGGKRYSVVDDEEDNFNSGQYERARRQRELEEVKAAMKRENSAR